MSGSRDLTRGPVWRGPLLFALPLFGSSLIQQMYNTVDVWFAGDLIGKAASAAVGGGSSAAPMAIILLNLCVLRTALMFLFMSLDHDLYLLASVYPFTRATAAGGMYPLLPERRLGKLWKEFWKLSWRPAFGRIGRLGPMTSPWCAATSCGTI